jgi:tetratricopeptide (TPR) repeat protein
MSESTPQRYRCLETTGTGGMGVVFRAEDLLLRRPVAIKILPGPPAGRRDVAARLLREARAAAALNHPAICTIYEVGTIGSGPGVACPDGTAPFPDGTPFIAMELVEGETLRRILDRPAPPRTLLLDIAIQIAEGLEAAHAGGIVHRDLKPSNIMVTPHGRVKILDFGLARPPASGRAASPETTSEETLSEVIEAGGALAGTVHYMSPEQAKGEAIGPPSDIFSFGTILYEMLAGRRPFEGATWASVLAGIMESEPEGLDAAAPDAGAALDRIVHRCLRKDPSGRFADAGELVRALRAAREGRAIEPAVPPGRAGRRRAAALAGGIAAALLVVAALLLFDRQRGPGVAPAPGAPPAGEATLPAPAAIAVLPFAFHGPDDLRYLADGMVTLLGTTLDGAGALRSVDARAILGLVARETIDVGEPQQAREVARRLGAGRYIVGDIFAAGKELRISAALYEAAATGPAVAEASAEGEAERVFDLIDGIARQLLLAQVGGPSERVTRVAALTTHSLPALKAYLEGERQFRAGHFERAIEAFGRAAATDDTFALAYYRLSVAAEWATRVEESRLAAEQAVRHAARLSDHDRRLLEASLAWRRGDTEEGERLYRALLGTYPDDVEARAELGEILFHGGPVGGRPLAAAREPFEKVLFYEPNHVPALVHLARVAASEGRLGDLDGLVRRLIALSPDGDRSLEAEALRLFAFGAERLPEDFLPAVDRAADVPLLLAATNAAVYTRNLAGAGSLVRMLAAPQRSSEARAQGLIIAALLEAARGRFGAALADLDRSAGLNPAAAQIYRGWLAVLPFVDPRRETLEAARKALDTLDPYAVRPSVTPTIYLSVHDGLYPHLRFYLLGLIDARLGEGQRALRFAVALRGLEAPPSAGPIGRALALGLEAHDPAGRLDPAARLAVVQEAAMKAPYQYIMSSPFFSQSLDRFLRAELAAELGRHEEALHWYGSFQSISTHDLVFLAPAHLRRGRIHEALGDRAAAIEQYRLFAGLWRDCDPDLRPLVDEAAERIEALEAGDGTAVR